MADAPQDPEALREAWKTGWDAAMGFRYVRVSRDEVVVEYDVADIHRQPYGIVHGGVHCGVVEAVCSTGAALSALARGQGGVVGIDNHTSFIRAVRITRGRRSQLWEATCTDPEGLVVSTGRVRLLVLERDEILAGERLRRG